MKKGFHLNKFVFPRHLEARLVTHGLITRDNAYDNVRYVGRTITGQDAFWSEELPDDAALMFDSSYGVNLSRELRVGIERLGRYNPGACGNIGINPIVKNVLSIVELSNLDQALAQGEHTVTTGNEEYVDSDRLNKLRSIHNDKYDLTNLVEFCTELNTCYANECYLAIPMLVRAIMDHIPPIFGFGTFKEVANNYGGGGKSFKDTMRFLDNSTRKIADTFLHGPIRKQEELPTRTEIDFRAQLGSLLREICRVLK